MVPIAVMEFGVMETKRQEFYGREVSIGAQAEKGKMKLKAFWIKRSGKQVLELQEL